MIRCEKGQQGWPGGMRMNRNLQLDGEVWGQVEGMTETWNNGSAQKSMRVSLTVTHSIRDMEPEEAVARQEPQWNHRDTNLVTKVLTQNLPCLKKKCRTGNRAESEGTANQ